jgi:hypothetical protein
MSEPFLDDLQSRLNDTTTTLLPKLYFSYNAKAQQTTIMTTDLNQLHLFLIQHLSGRSIQPEMIGQLLTQCFVIVQGCFGAAAEQMDINTTGSVCGRSPIFTYTKSFYPIFPTGHGITNIEERC